MYWSRPTKLVPETVGTTCSTNKHHYLPGTSDRVQTANTIKEKKKKTAGPSVFGDEPALNVYNMCVWWKKQ